MRTETTTYSCDKCSKLLRSSANAVNIVTTLRDTRYWSRLHVRIEHSHGVDNSVKTEQADICKECAVLLLKDALKRVQEGERASAGTENAEMRTWR